MIEWIVFDGLSPTYESLFKPDQAIVMFGFYLIAWLVETAILATLCRAFKVKLEKFSLEKLFFAVGTDNWLTYLIGFFMHLLLYLEAELPSMLGFILIYITGAICLLALLQMHWFQPEKEEEQNGE